MIEFYFKWRLYKFNKEKNATFTLHSWGVLKTFIGE
jgi:hypothetical protein